MTQFQLISLINPLTLLIVPLLGCIIILIYPSLTSVQGSFNKILNPSIYNESDTLRLDSLSFTSTIREEGDTATSPLSLSTLAYQHGIVENKEIVLKKIALITAFINLLLSILM
jgi:hypothetical protein